MEIVSLRDKIYTLCAISGIPVDSPQFLNEKGTSLRLIS